MKLETLSQAQAMLNRIQRLKGALGGLSNKIRPQQKGAMAEGLKDEGSGEPQHEIRFEFQTQGTYAIKIPKLLAARFLVEIERQYESDLQSAEREFERL